MFCRFQNTGHICLELTHNVKVNSISVTTECLCLFLIETKPNPALLSYYDYVKDREIKELIPEMIPEFVVPDLTDFQVELILKNEFIK